MKQLLIAMLAAVGLGFAAQSARADCAFEYSCCRHFSYVHTRKQRCITITSHCNPLPCAPSCCGPYCGPAMWDGLAAYGYGYGAHAYGVAAAAQVATNPAPAPSFSAPQPTPAPKAPSANGLQQAGYFFYAPIASTGYNYNYGYGYGTGYGYGYSQAPSYWYDN